MRKIRFRGKSLEDGQWNYGDLSYMAGQTYVTNDRCREGRPIYTFAVAPSANSQAA